MLTLLLLLILPSDIKAQTRTHLQALQSVSAVESIGKYAYPVAIFNNRQQTERPPHFHGPYIKDAWSSLLLDSLFWHYEEAGDHFTFKDLCTWEENGRQIIPCSGEILSKNADIERIVVKYETKKWGVVELAVNYDFVPLSEPRLVAKTGTLRWADKETRVTWSNYREFHASEPKISEWSEENETKSNVTAQSAKIESATNANTNNTVRQMGKELDEGSLNDNSESPRQLESSNIVPLENLLTPSQGETQTVKIKSRWWRIFKR